MFSFLCYLALAYIFFFWFFDIYKKDRDANAVLLWCTSPFLFPIFMVAYGLNGLVRFQRWMRGA